MDLLHKLLLIGMDASRHAVFVQSQIAWKSDDVWRTTLPVGNLRRKGARTKIQYFGKDRNQ